MATAEALARSPLTVAVVAFVMAVAAWGIGAATVAIGPTLTGYTIAALLAAVAVAAGFVALRQSDRAVVAIPATLAVLAGLIYIVLCGLLYLVLLSFEGPSMG
jgi:hypothetical protein